jgi:serine/threonine-protein kinase RsbW
MTAPGRAARDASASRRPADVGKVVEPQDQFLPPARWLHCGDALTWRRVFPGRVDQAAPARRFAGFLLTDAGCGEDAEFVIAELASNALLHTRSGKAGGWFGIEVALGEYAHIAVRDLGGGGVPSVAFTRPVDELPEHGRGLAAVSTLALTMGWMGNTVDGHTVWARLALCRWGRS